MTVTNSVITRANSIYAEFWTAPSGSLLATSYAIQSPSVTHRLSMGGSWGFSLPMADYDPSDMGVGRYVRVRGVFGGSTQTLFWGKVRKQEEQFVPTINMVSLDGEDMLGEWGEEEIAEEEIYDEVVLPATKVYREYWQAVAGTGWTSSEEMPEANDEDSVTKAVLRLVDRDQGNFPTDESDIPNEHIFLYVGSAAPISRVDFSFDTGWPQEQTAELKMQQFLPTTEWTEVTPVSNTTYVSERPLAQDGSIQFAKASKEIQLTHAKNALYWVRFSHVGTGHDLDPILIREIAVLTAGAADNDIAQIMSKCAPAGWTLHGSSPTSTAQKHQMTIAGEKPLRALVRLAERSGELFALTSTRQIRWMPSPIASGLTVKEKPESGDSATSCYMKNLRRRVEQRDIATRVYLEGAGSDPEAAVTLEHLKAGTYTLPTGYAIAGKWLIHTALEAELLQQIPRRQKMKDVGALWGGTGGNPQVALELLKAGLAYLAIHAEHSQHFSGTLTGVRKELSNLHCGMLLDVQTAIRNANGDVVEDIDESLVLVEMQIQVDMQGELTYEVILAKQAEYLPGAEYLEAMQEMKAADQSKHFQPSSEHRLVRGASAGAGGGGGGGGGGSGDVDWLAFNLHVAETFDAHEIGTQIAAHAAEEGVHNIPAQIDADIATHNANAGAHTAAFAAHSAIDDAHHDPVTVIVPLTQSGQQLGLATGNGVEVSGGLLRARPTDIAGDGLYASSTQLHVYTGNGLQIESDIVKVKPSDIAGDGLGSSATQLSLSPSTLSAASTNAASGSGHSHAVTAVSDADATPEALLKSDSAGHVKVRDLTVANSATITNDVTVGDNVIVGGNINADEYVRAPQVVASDEFQVGASQSEAVMRAQGDVDTGIVRMRKAPELIEDTSITLDGGGVCRFDWFMGQWATAVRGAAFIAHYNGSLGSSTGTNYTASGAVSYEDSPFGRALQSYDTFVNLVKNPSSEVDGSPAGTGYGSDGTVTVAQSSEWAYVGTKSRKWSGYSAGTANLYWVDTVSPLAVSTTYTFSVVVRRENKEAVSATQIRPNISWGTGSTGYVTDATYEDLGDGAWRISKTFTTGGAAGTAFVLILQMQAGYTAEAWYTDVWQLIAQPLAGPIFDGDTPGCSWSGTAHASTSTRTALNLQYESQNPDDWTRRIFEESEGSILAWLKLASITDADSRGILYLESGWGGPAISFALTPSGKPYVAGEGFEWTYEDAIPSGYVMLALTWSLAGGPLVYVNGGLVGVDDDTGTWDGFQIVQGEMFRVGDGLNGAIDSLVISTNELTAEEIDRIYKANAPVFGVNMGGESRGFSATTPNGRVWADSRGLHFANNEGEELGKIGVGDDGYPTFNGVNILTPTDTDDPPPFNRLRLVDQNGAAIFQLFQDFFTTRLVNRSADWSQAGLSLRAVPDNGTDDVELFLGTQNGGGSWVEVNGVGGELLYATESLFKAAASGIKYENATLTYKNDAGDAIIVGDPLADDDWIAPSLSNSWANYGSSKSTAGYRLMPDGTVALKGVLKSGSSATATMFTLPAGYRPSEIRRLVGAANSAVGIVEITTGGAVSFVVNGSTTQSSLDGIRFPL